MMLPALPIIPSAVQYRWLASTAMSPGWYWSVASVSGARSSTPVRLSLRRPAVYTWPREHAGAEDFPDGRAGSFGDPGGVRRRHHGEYPRHQLGRRAGGG